MATEKTGEQKTFKTKFKAFENDTQSTSAGPGNGLTFENSEDSVNVYGDFEIDKNSSPEKIDELVDVLMSIRAKLKR